MNKKNLRIYNTLSRRKEIFAPLSPNEIKMHTCGQTVYNDMHIGNARFYVVFDTIRRYLEHCGYAVQFAQNFTDVDDKIIARAAQENRPAAEIAATYIAHTREDLENLNVLKPTHEPKATEEMPEIIAMISELLAIGAAYEIGGTVYFDTSKAPDYGKLSRKNPDDLLAGARVEVDNNKKNAADFVLWKPADTEPHWNSPWGSGRPGWHIECSAMIRKYLGEEIDIHGGAADLIFPHHENEIAQTETLTKKPFSRFWMHCGVLTVNHKKMSKSRGNFQTLREVAERFPYDVIRFYLLSAHYRMPMEFGDEMLAAAEKGLTRIKNCYAALENHMAEGPPAETALYVEKFHMAMHDDFNTADAVTAIFEWVKYVNTHFLPSKPHHGGLKQQLADMCGLLGIVLEETPALPDEADGEIEALIVARNAARAAKNFAEADRIRNDLAAQGILLEDTPEGVRWKRA